MGQTAAGLGLPVGGHMLRTGLLLLALSVTPLALGWFLPGDDAEDRPVRAGTPAQNPSAQSMPHQVTALSVGVLIIVSLLCAAAMFPEDVGHNWSSLLLAEQGAAAAQVGLGLVAIQGTMTVGRLVGDSVIDALGTRRVIAGGGLLVMAGMGLALAWSSVPGTLVGMAISGLGCAVAVPVTYSAADDIPGLRPGVGLTIVSWLARVGGLLMPPLVGWLSDLNGLWVALAYGLLGGVIMAVGWPVLRREQAGR